ncbi:glycoside hydrolase family 3 N-terminal domain-containing protein [Streptomyces sp. SLBN-118]|uniref:glycoside hydrolase family 3 N-terminal domain-containing protein n=1 Tax=Streptomyces sp. SLBN-118 TaxID=2768454 RepID=UPI001357C9E5|nr:glycoside hydrolase family 3 N-terminal domain-containing protein [Streptomyces sp. SLBN-118]
MGDGQEATALSAPVSLAASFDTTLAGGYGKVIGQDEGARGYPVPYAPMVNIVRLPQGGCDYETLGEDPQLAGAMAVENIKGIQRDQRRRGWQDAWPRTYSPRWTSGR